MLKTPVLLCGEDHISNHQSKKVKYKKGELLHDMFIPPVCSVLPNTIVIDLPVTDIEAYISKFLAWLPLKSDEVLIDYLQVLIRVSKQEKQTCRPSA